MKGDKSKPCIVYKVVNLINGKFYIGVTRLSMRRRMSEHRCHAKKKRNNGAFYRAIRKYGPDAFAVFKLKECATAVEALAEEIRLIALLKPQYNSTKGGENPGQITEDGRRRLSEFHKGKKWGLGRKVSEQTKRRLAVIARERGSLRNYGHLGPRAMMRKVLCLDTGELFESASAAARHFDVNKSYVIEICNGTRQRGAADGHYFCYSDVSLSEVERKRRVESIRAEMKIIRVAAATKAQAAGAHPPKPVICLDDGRVYPNQKEAAKAYSGVHQGSISALLRSGRPGGRTGGLRFAYVDIH